MSKDSPKQRLQSQIFFVLGLLATLCFSSAALARPPVDPPHPPGGPGGPGGFLARHADELDLDTEVRDAIRELLEDSRGAAEEQQRELHAAREAMHALLDTDAPREEAVMKQAERIGALELEATKHRLSTMLRIRALMTPEQRAKLTALREGRHTDRRNRIFERLDESCKQALDERCPDARPGFETLSCLREHRDAIAPACRESMDRLRGRRPGPPPPGGPHGGEEGDAPPPPDDL